MREVVSVFLSLMAGALGWVALEFFGRPVRKFFDLSGDIRRQMLRYDNVRARWRQSRIDLADVEPTDLTDDEIARLEEAERALRDLAAQVRSFGETERMATWFLKKLGYNPFAVSRGLFGLSNSIDTSGQAKAQFKAEIERALRIPDAT